MKHILLLSSLFLTSCAAIVDGSDQEVMIETPGAVSANCTLSNGHGSWNVPSTPGARVVSGAHSNLDISCIDAATGATGKKSVDSDTNAWAFGNILFGGLIGVGYDMISGAAYVYPEKILVPMSIATANTVSPALGETILQPQSIATPQTIRNASQPIAAPVAIQTQRPAEFNNGNQTTYTPQDVRYVPIPYGKKLPSAPHY